MKKLRFPALFLSSIAAVCSTHANYTVSEDSPFVLISATSGVTETEMIAIHVDSIKSVLMDGRFIHLETATGHTGNINPLFIASHRFDFDTQKDTKVFLDKISGILPPDDFLRITQPGPRVEPYLLLLHRDLVLSISLNGKTVTLVTLRSISGDDKNSFATNEIKWDTDGQAKTHFNDLLKQLRRP